MYFHDGIYDYVYTLVSCFDHTWDTAFTWHLLVYVILTLLWFLTGHLHWCRHVFDSSTSSLSVIPVSELPQQLRDEPGVGRLLHLPLELWKARATSDTIYPPHYRCHTIIFISACRSLLHHLSLYFCFTDFPPWFRTKMQLLTGQKVTRHLGIVFTCHSIPVSE